MRGARKERAAHARPEGESIIREKREEKWSSEEKNGG